MLLELDPSMVNQLCVAGRRLTRPDRPLGQDWGNPCPHPISHILAVEEHGAIDYMALCDCHMMGLRQILPADGIRRVA